MGASSSTERTVTVKEDSSPGTVTVSESVARRLLGQPEIKDSKEGESKNPKTVNEDELLKLQTYYKRKLQDLEKKNNQLYHTTTEQFAKAVEEVEQKFVQTTSSPVCEDLQQEVLKCYQDNPKYTLLCNPQVKAFSECVQKQREAILTTTNRKGS